MLRIIILLGCCATLFAATPLHAKESDFEKSMARGVSAIENGSYSEAVTELQGALSERPDDSQALLYLGIAKARINDQSAEADLKQALRGDPGNPRINLELGNFYLKRGVYAEASDYYEATVQAEQQGELADSAREGLRLIASKSSGKRWSAMFLTGAQYDDNVILNADGIPLPSGVSHKGDWRGVFNLGLGYQPIKTETMELRVGYDFYQSLHARLDQFDLIQNRLDLSGNYHLSSRLSTGLAYSFDYLHIGGDPYAANHNLTPSIIYTTVDGLKSTLSYRFRDSSYKTHPLFSTNSERSGISHQIALLETLPLGDRMRFKLGYGYTRESTEKRYWDSNEHKLAAGVMAQLPFQLIGDLSLEGTFRRYDALFPGTTTMRDDTTWSGTALLSRPLGEHLALILGFTAIRNQSTLAPYDYTRTITSLLAQMRF